MDEKIRFIDEVKVKKQVLEAEEENAARLEIPYAQSNPIRANLMKFVNFKGKKFSLKDLF